MEFYRFSDTRNLRIWILNIVELLKKWWWVPIVVIVVILLVAVLCSETGTSFPHCPCKLHS